MKILAYVLRWTDLENKEHIKEYTDRLKVYKAAKWLRDGGAPQVDVAVRLPEKQPESVAS